MIQTTTKTQLTRLDSGVRVITEHIPHTGSAGISVMVDAGPQDESVNQSGLAHLCEHALFLGTPLRDSTQLAQLIDTAGGQLGAFTAPDYTCFYAHVLDDYVSYALDLLGDILVASSFPEAALTREKDVVCQEIMQYQDSPNHLVLEALKDVMWPNDTLANSITGTVEDVQGLTRSDVIEFISRNYTPDRIVVAAVGSVEHDSIVEQTQDAFWTLRGCSSPRQRPPVQPVGGVRITARNTQQCTFNIAIPVPSYASGKRHALHVVNNALGGGMSSRLCRALRERTGMSYMISSDVLAYRRAGLLVIEGAASPENLLASVQLVLFELAALAVGQNPIGEEELWKSKMQVRGQSRLAADIIPNRVARLVTQNFHFNETFSVNRILEDIDKITMEDVCDIASSVLLPGMKNLGISVVGPVGSEHSVIDDLNGLHECYTAIGCE